MSNVDGTIVPVWTLSTTQGATVPAFADEGALTPERLTELRSALAAFASAPLVTLEAHPLPTKRDRASSGLPLDAMSPLAKELSRLVSGSSKSPAVQQVTQSTEVLYRMHVPAKVASQFGKGLVKPMTSKAVTAGSTATWSPAPARVRSRPKPPSSP